MKTPVDLAIIGGGIAGITLCEKALDQGKSCILIDNPHHHGSTWAAGALIHPLVFKRLTIAWPGLDACKEAIQYYSQTAKTHWHPTPIYRRIGSIHELEQWKKKQTDPSFATVIGPITNEIPGPNPGHLPFQSHQLVSSEYGFGQVLIGGWLDVQSYLLAKKNQLASLGPWVDYQVNSSCIDTHNQLISLPGSNHTLRYTNLILATGISDPSWQTLIPESGRKELIYRGFYGVKGDCLDLYLPELNLNSILLGPVFIIPLGNGSFRVGSTYQREFKDDTPDPDQAYELCCQLEPILSMDREMLLTRISSSRAGIRPATRDRRPYLGQLQKNLWIYNGLGTRGLLVAPLMAEVFLNHLNTGLDIPAEWSLERLQRP